MTTINVNYPVQDPTPSMLIRERLEVRPRSTDIERSLRAEVRDPLWMLTRQWQFGEFKGEDAGSAVFTKFEYTTKKIKTIPVPGTGGLPYDGKLPLDTIVQAVKAPMDIALRIEIGRFWFKLLDANSNTTNNLSQYKSTFILRFPLENPESVTDLNRHTYLASNNEATSLLITSRTRVCDGGKLIEYLELNANLGAGDSISSLVTVTINANDLQRMKDLGVELLAWYRKNYSTPLGSDDFWNPNSLSYEAKINIEKSNTKSDQFNIVQNTQGDIDWFAFDKLPGDVSQTNTVVTPDKKTLILSEINFPGMPRSRYWEFEDGSVDFAKYDEKSTDLARIVMNEFALLYSNDWSVIPLKLPYGTKTTINSLKVKDVFGLTTIVEGAGKGQDDDWQKWRMYNSSTKGVDPYQIGDIELFLPPLLPESLESEPIETINFIRDEMANMVWAIEKVVPNELGGGKNGYDAALQFRKAFEKFKPGINVVPQTFEKPDVPLKYELTTNVPENWIPMLPVNSSANVNQPELKLQRGAMLRYIKGYENSAVRPRTYLMRKQASPYLVNEEEVPRSGVIISSKYQRTRWYDGRIILWYKHTRTIGKGEGASQLKYDQVGYK